MTADVPLWAILTVVGVLIALTGYGEAQAHKWSSRGITTHLGWTPTFDLGMAAGAAAAASIYPTWGSGAAIAAAAAAWLGVVAVSSDIKTRKVPWDLAYPVSLVGLVCFVPNYTIEGLLAFGAGFAGLVALPGVVRWLTRKGLGASDVRILWAITATCSWWAGQTWLLYGLIAACLIQMPVKLIARILNLGTLVEVPVRGTASTENAGESSPEDGNPDAPVKMRRELPFAPAIVLGITLCIAWGTHTAYGACQMWNVLGTCH